MAPTSRTDRRRPVVLALQIAVGAVVLLWSLVPLYWALVIALANPADLQTASSSLLPRTIDIGSFRRLLDGVSSTSGPFLLSIVNSVVQAGATTVVTLLLALPAAYGFARLQFAGRRLLLGVITVTLAVPVYLVLIPLFQIETSFGLINTQPGVVAVLVSAALPLAIWILRSHVATLPPDIEAAARLDGAGSVTVLLRIVGPLVAPGLVAAAVVTFLTTWGAFLVPLVYASAQGLQPVTVLIPTFAGRYSSDYGLQAAAGLLAVLPPAILVIALQRHLLSGLLKGATK